MLRDTTRLMFEPLDAHDALLSKLEFAEIALTGDYFLQKPTGNYGGFSKYPNRILLQGLQANMDPNKVNVGLENLNVIGQLPVPDAFVDQLPVPDEFFVLPDPTLFD